MRDLAAVYARPYFTVSNESLTPPPRDAVATCVPGSKARGDNALFLLRTALWGRSEGQSIATLLRVLIRHGLLTREHVQEVRHAPACGHLPEDLDPDRWP